MKRVLWMLLVWSAASLAQTWEERLATGRKALAAGNPAWALQELERALAASAGARPGDQARIRFYIGIAHSDLGNYDRAAESQTAALKILDAQTAPNSQSLAAVTHELGTALQAQAKYAEAEPFHRRSVALAEGRPGADPVSVARSLNGLAGALVQLGRQQEAQRLLARARSLLAKSPDPDLADLVNLNLADSYRRQGRFADAGPLYRSALVNIQKRAGAGDLYAAAARIGLGFVLIAQGSAADGEKLYRQGLAIYANRLGEKHPIVRQYRDERARLKK